MGEQANNIAENLFEAISLLANDAIKNAGIDKTIECIVTQADIQTGIYKVLYDTIEFQAAALQGVVCKRYDKVWVRIPEGDYTKDKMIIGVIGNENSEYPVNYVNPLSKYVPITNNLISGFAPVSIEVTNDNNRTETRVGEPISVASLVSARIEKENTTKNIYNTISIETTFQTMLPEDIYKGNYGVALALYQKNGAIAYCSLDSAEFFGKPYDFIIPSKQKKAFKINDISTLEAISISLYQLGNFAARVGLSGSIYLKDLKLSIGTDVSAITDNTLEIYTTSDSAYKYSADAPENTKTIGLNWYNKDIETDKFLGFSDGIYDPNYSELDYLEQKIVHDSLIAEKTEGRYWTEPALRTAATLTSIQKELDKIFEITGTTSNFASGLLNLNTILPSISLIDSFNPEEEIQYISMLDYITRLRRVSNTAGSFGAYQSAVQDSFDSIKKIVNEKCSIEGNSEENVDWSNFITPLNTIAQYFTNTDTNSDTFYYCSQEAFNQIQGSYGGYLADYETLNTKMNGLYNLVLEHITKIQDLCSDIDIYLNDNNFVSGQEYLDDFSEEIYEKRYSIYWYRAKNGFLDETNNLMGSGWESIPELDNFGIPGAGEIIEGVVYFDKVLSMDNSKRELLLDYMQPEEKIVALVYYNHEKFISNTLTFTRESITGSIVPDTTINLTIEHGENSKPSYQNYLANYEITTGLEYNKNRVLIPKITSTAGATLKDFIGGNIYWYLPATNTMLQAGAAQKLEGYGVGDSASSVPESYYLEGYICYSQNITLDNYNKLNFAYRIKDRLNPGHINNTIVCRVVKDSWNLLDEIYISFMTHGNSGTNYTFLLAPVGQRKALRTGETLQLEPQLFDPSGNPMPIFTDAAMTTEKKYGVKFDYDWKTISDENIVTPSTSIQKSIDNGQIECLKITAGTESNKIYCGILKVTVKVNMESGSTTLVAYYAVPFDTSSGDDIYSLYGATQIDYNSMGSEKTWKKEPYQLFKNIDDEIEDVVWEIIPQNADFPILTTAKELSPKNTYVELDDFPVVKGELENGLAWYQPIIIAQSSHDYELLNGWDGKFEINKEGGYILSNMLVAGTKDEGTFTGVVMGDVSLAGGNNRMSGLLGFQDGQESFGFKTDGTAFLGKSGHGRIEFDGTRGVIESPSEQGMRINLEEGSISARKFSLLADNIQLDESNLFVQSDGFILSNDGSSNNKPYICISQGETDLLKITQNDFFMQSSNGSVKFILQSSSEDKKVGIEAASFDLQVNDGEKDFRLSSTAQDYPLNINNKFLIKWDGGLYINSIDDPENAAEIKTGFSVDQTGKAKMWNGRNYGSFSIRSDSNSNQMGALVFAGYGGASMGKLGFIDSNYNTFQLESTISNNSTRNFLVKNFSTIQLQTPDSEKPETMATQSWVQQNYLKSGDNLIFSNEGKYFKDDSFNIFTGNNFINASTSGEVPEIKIGFSGTPLTTLHIQHNQIFLERTEGETTTIYEFVTKKKE